MTVLDEQQHEVADWLANSLKKVPANRRALWQLTGAVGSGKTNVLRLLGPRLLHLGLKPIFISAPADEVDSAAIALLETASQLEAYGLANGDLAAVRDPKSRWDNKLNAVTTAINKHLHDVAIVCDEPHRWYHTSHSDLDETPDHAARSFAEWIAKDARCRRVISGWIPDDTTPLGTTGAPRLPDGREVLTNGFYWGSLDQQAAILHDNLPAGIPGRSVWEMRLCVALCLLKPVEEVATVVESFGSADSLLQEFLDLVELAPEHATLCNALARLSLARTSLPRTSIERYTQELNSIQRSIVESCLMDWDGDQGTLHPLVRRETMSRARDPHRLQTNHLWRLPTQQRMAMHQLLIGEYPTDAGTPLRNALESLHHDSLGGGTTALDSDFRLLFVEQLHEIGRTLSYAHHEHARAVEVFRVALRLDPLHSYGHHYLAFNLDYLAQSPAEVEEHYKRAISLQPSHPWWWSRWVSYLATRGRFAEARTQWRAATDALSISEDSTPDWMFLSLHRWVARWLLHWAELDFAEEVLRSIPAQLRTTDTSIQALWNLLRALRQAERGVCVFPLTVPASSWWSPTPHTDLPISLHDSLLKDFQPARVEHVDEESQIAFLLAAKRPSATDKTPIYFDAELSKQDVIRDAYGFEWQDLGEGRFLEIGYYVGGGRRIALHRENAWRDPDLLPLVPPPDRWFQRASEGAWAATEGMN